MFVTVTVTAAVAVAYKRFQFSISIVLSCEKECGSWSAAETGAQWRISRRSPCSVIYW